MTHMGYIIYDAKIQGMIDGLHHQEDIGFSPLTGETQYEKNSREFIRASTQSELLGLQKHYNNEIRKQEALQKSGEVTSPVMKQILSQLLSLTQEQIKEKYESVKKAVDGVSPKLRGDVPSSLKPDTIQISQNGMVYIGFKIIGKKEGNSTQRTLSGGINITYEDYLKKTKGKVLDIGDYTITLLWGKEGEPILQWKKTQQEGVEDTGMNPADLSQSKESPKVPIEIEKTKRILEDLRAKILTDTSPIANRIFGEKNRGRLDLSRMTYVAGSNMDTISYAQVMEDGGKIYSVWGEVVDKMRPLIIIDRENSKILFSGTIGNDNLIIPHPGFVWPKNRDMHAYKFQPKINIQWKL